MCLRSLGKTNYFGIVELLRIRITEPTWVRVGLIIRELAKKPGWSQTESLSLCAEPEKKKGGKVGELTAVQGNPRQRAVPIPGAN